MLNARLSHRTHGGYGIGSSQTVLAEHAPNSQLHDPFSMEADQERRTLDQVTSWPDGITVAR